MRLHSGGRDGRAVVLLMGGCKEKREVKTLR